MDMLLFFTICEYTDYSISIFLLIHVHNNIVIVMDYNIQVHVFCVLYEIVCDMKVTLICLLLVTHCYRHDSNFLTCFYVSVVGYSLNTS